MEKKYLSFYTVDALIAKNVELFPHMKELHSTFLEMADGKSIDQLKSDSELIALVSEINAASSSYSSTAWMISKLLAGEAEVTDNWEKYFEYCKRTAKGK